jgi:arginine kinase
MVDGKLPTSPKEVESMDDSAFLELVEYSRDINPENRSVKFFNQTFYTQFADEDKTRIRQIMAPGLMSTDSKIGCYVRNPQDYNKFGEWLGQLINDYHNTDISKVKQEHDWDLEGKKFDLAEIDPSLNHVSMRIRTAAIPEGFNLPAEQTLQERLDFENKMVEVFDKLGGTYYSLTPGSKHEISKEKHQELVDQHYMFKDMTEDPHLQVSDLASNWPHGRGMFMKDVEGTDFKLIVWVGEEDLLRVMCMGHGSELDVVFNQLKEFRENLEANGLKLVQDEVIGNTTSCPSNIGTSMRMSILLDTELMKDGGIGKDELKAVATPLGLQVRGLDGETSKGESTIYDVSPSARFGVTEAEMLKNYYAAMQKLIPQIKQK